nr:unnamed protein product [Digitaria exilis]
MVPVSWAVLCAPLGHRENHRQRLFKPRLLRRARRPSAGPGGALDAASKPILAPFGTARCVWALWSKALPPPPSAPPQPLVRGGKEEREEEGEPEARKAPPVSSSTESHPQREDKRPEGCSGHISSWREDEYWGAAAATCSSRREDRDWRPATAASSSSASTGPRVTVATRSDARTCDSGRRRRAPPVVCYARGWAEEHLRRADLVAWREASSFIQIPVYTGLALEMSDEEKELGSHEIFEMHREEWILMNGKNDAASFHKSNSHQMGKWGSVGHPFSLLCWPREPSPESGRRALRRCPAAALAAGSGRRAAGYGLRLRGREGRSPEAEARQHAVAEAEAGGRRMGLAASLPPYAKTKEVSTENCKMEFRFAHVKRSVEATISARIISGSGSFIARFTAHTTSITGEDVVLLDSQGREVAVAEDGEIELRRRVVVVAEQCELILCTETMPLGGGDAAENTSFLRKIPFYARSALRSRVYFDIGSIRIQIVVAWSL